MIKGDIIGLFSVAKETALNEQWIKPCVPFNKTEISPKLECHLKWNVTETKMPPTIEYHQHLNVTKI